MCKGSSRESNENPRDLEFLTLHVNPYLKILRPKNLFLIGLTQIFLYFLLVIPYVGLPSLDYKLFALLVIDTMLIAGSGYIINDLLDVKRDLINKPSDSYIPKLISVHQAHNYYYFIVLFFDRQ